MSKREEELGSFLRRKGIRALSRKAVPTLLNHLTGRQASADFYVPETDLYIEVKGQMTFDAIRKMATLARSTPRYYLYQHDDYDWQPRIEDWPQTALSEANTSTIRARVGKAREKHLREHPSRETKGGLYKGHDLRHNTELQLQELLVLTNDPQAAAAASRVTLARLDRYLNNMAIMLRPLELFSRWHATD